MTSYEYDPILIIPFVSYRIPVCWFNVHRIASSQEADVQRAGIASGCHRSKLSKFFRVTGAWKCWDFPRESTKRCIANSTSHDIFYDTCHLRWQDEILFADLQTRLGDQTCGVLTVCWISIPKCASLHPGLNSYVGLAMQHWVLYHLVPQECAAEWLGLSIGVSLP